jgi:hypothetical protein
MFASSDAQQQRGDFSFPRFTFIIMFIVSSLFMYLDMP